MTNLASDGLTKRGDDPLFPVASMIVSAADHANRARLLLRTPDAVVVSHGAAMQDACVAAGFMMGAYYVTVRSSLLHALRDNGGELPPEYAQQAELWRRGLAAIAGGINA